MRTVFAQQLSESERLGSSVVKWAAVVVGLLVAVVVIESVRRHGRRDRQVKAAVVAAGMQYNDSDPAGIRDIRFDAFRYAPKIQVSNVATTKVNGLIVRAFDFASYDEIKVKNGRNEPDLMDLFEHGEDAFAADFESTKRVFGRTRSGAFVKLPAFLPPLRAIPANALTRTFERLAAEDIDFESDEFNRNYDVRCADRRFASLFFDAQMIDFVLRQPERRALETFGNYVLLHGKLAEPGHVPGLAQAMCELATIVNPLVYSEYPTVDGIEYREAMSAWQNRPNGAGGYF